VDAHNLKTLELKEDSSAFGRQRYKFMKSLQASQRVKDLKHFVVTTTQRRPQCSGPWNTLTVLELATEWARLESLEVCIVAPHRMGNDVDVEKMREFARVSMPYSLG